MKIRVKRIHPLIFTLRIYKISWKTYPNLTFLFIKGDIWVRNFSQNHISIPGQDISRGWKEHSLRRWIYTWMWRHNSMHRLPIRVLLSTLNTQRHTHTAIQVWFFARIRNLPHPHFFFIEQSPCPVNFPAITYAFFCVPVNFPHCQILKLIE